jgi:hypothetical protein
MHISLALYYKLLVSSIVNIVHIKLSEVQHRDILYYSNPYPRNERLIATGEDRSSSPTERRPPSDSREGRTSVSNVVAR